MLEGLKNAGLVYNDADFCRKVGIKASFLSEMKAGKKPFTTATRVRIEETFPDFFNRKTVPIREDEPTLGEMYRALCDHDVRFHELANRILDGMGVGKKEGRTA